MKRVLPYYPPPPATLQAVIRYGFTPWVEFPHVYLANMKINEDSIRAFFHLYGSPFEGFGFERPLPKKIREAMDRPGWPVSEELVQGAQEILRAAWRHAPPHPEITAGPKKGLLSSPPETVLQVTATGVEIHCKDIWSFLRLAFACDAALNKLKICGNPDCETPYFRESRKGQTFCTHKCAVLMNVRKFRQNPKRKRR